MLMGVHDQYFFGSEQGQVSSSSERSNEHLVHTSQKTSVNILRRNFAITGLTCFSERKHHKLNETACGQIRKFYFSSSIFRITCIGFAE